MTTFCVSSSVSNFHAPLDYSLCEKIVGADFHQMNLSVPFLIITEEKLRVLIVRLEKIIDNLLERSGLNEQGTGEIEYKGLTYKFNVRNHEHFHLVWIMNIYNMAVYTLKHNSQIYLFNTDLLDRNCGGSIIAYLRNHFSLTVDQIHEGINLLWEKLRLDKSVDKVSIELGIENLIKYGLIFKDEITGEYSVTGTGFMFWG